MRTYNYLKTEIITRTMNLANESSIGGTGGKKKLPRLRNGEQQSWSFWLYLPTYNVSTNGTHKLLWKCVTDVEQGASATPASATPNTIATFGSPIVFMDGRTNRMYISFATTAGGVVNDLGSLIPTDASEGLRGNKYVTAVIEYVPLQRWINITFTVQDNVITIYLDGEVYSVKSISDTRFTVSQAGVRQRFLLYPDLDARASVEGNLKGTFSAGYFSALHHYNYVIAQKQVQDIYRYGPHVSSGQGWFSWFTFGTWRLRSPFERLPDDGSDTNQAHNSD